MTFDEFSRRAQEALESIPAEYREGIDGVTTVEAASKHPELPGVVTLGECLTQGHLSDWRGPETTRSRVVLYYGSFRQMAAADADFDWEAELWETLTHELQHHIESLADQDALGDLDYAMDESFKRELGEPFDPWYYRAGEDLGQGVFRVEDEVYVERAFSDATFAETSSLDFVWEGSTYRIPLPPERGDLHFVVVHGIEPNIQLVLMKRATFRDRLRTILRLEIPIPMESEVTAERIA